MDLKKVFTKLIVITFILLIIAGISYEVNYLAFQGGIYDIRDRIRADKMGKTTFTYYFFWYDNNSGGPAELTSHIYSNPESRPPGHAYYLENSSLLNQTELVPAASYIYLDIDSLKSNKSLDFDMFQTHAAVVNGSESDLINVFALTREDFSVFKEDFSSDSLKIQKRGSIAGRNVYHRALYRMEQTPIVIVENPGNSDLEVSIYCNIFNDTLSHHPDGAKFPGDFSYKNVEWHKYEILNIMRTGVDVILPVYWGSWSGEWNIIGMENLVKAYEDLEIEYGLKSLPKIAMFMDTTGLMVANANAKPDLTTDSGKAIFNKMIIEFFSIVPEKYRFKPENKDLVWMYSTAFIEKYDDSTFESAVENFTATFDGSEGLIFIGGGFDDNARKSIFGTYSWGTSLNGPKVRTDGIAIGSIGPGFYSEGAYRCGCQYDLGIRVRERENGTYMMESYNEIKRNCQWLVFEVWNEFHEGNDITETIEYSDFYINLTAQIVSDFKEVSFMDIRESDVIAISLVCVFIGLAAILYYLKKKSKK